MNQKLTAKSILLLSILILPGCQRPETTEEEVREWTLRHMPEANKVALEAVKEEDPEIYGRLKKLPVAVLAPLLQEPEPASERSHLRLLNATETSKETADSFLRLVLSEETPDEALRKIQKLLREPVWVFSNSDPKIYLRAGKLDNPAEVGNDWTIPLGNSRALWERLARLCRSPEPVSSEEGVLISLGVANRLLAGNPNLAQSMIAVGWAKPAIEALEPEGVTPPVRQALEHFTELYDIEQVMAREKVWARQHPLKQILQDLSPTLQPTIGEPLLEKARLLLKATPREPLQLTRGRAAEWIGEPRETDHPGFFSN